MSKYTTRRSQAVLLQYILLNFNDTTSGHVSATINVKE